VTSAPDAYRLHSNHLQVHLEKGIIKVIQMYKCISFDDTRFINFLEEKIPGSTKVISDLSQLIQLLAVSCHLLQAWLHAPPSKQQRPNPRRQCRHSTRGSPEGLDGTKRDQGWWFLYTKKHTAKQVVLEKNECRVFQYVHLLSTLD